jgi:hypothetical protein
MASFVNSKLTSVKILFQESFLNKNGHINSFSAVKALLDKKYGEVELKVNWKNRLYADDQENFGMAIGMGHLVIGSQWEDPHTTVSMLLTGENFKVNHLLQYGRRS